MSPAPGAISRLERRSVCEQNVSAMIGSSGWTMTKQARIDFPARAAQAPPGPCGTLR
jgi:hypothetical protein